MAYMNSRQHGRLVVDIDGFAVMPGSATVVQCCVRDISLGGAYLVIDRGDDSCDLRVGQTLELHFWGVGRLAAQVVYKGRDGVGVRFRNSHRSQVALAERLGDFMMHQLHAWGRDSVGGARSEAEPPAQAQSGDGRPDEQEPGRTVQATADEDRRTSPRRRLIRRGKIIFQNRNCIMGCVILDISEGGARIQPLDTAYLPEEFTLRVRDGEVRSCELIWRNGDVVGVRFLAPVPASLDRPQHVLALHK